MEKKLKSWQGWLLFGGSMVVVFVLGLCVSALMERRAEVASIFNNRKNVIKGIEARNELFKNDFPREYQTWTETAKTDFESEFNGNIAVCRDHSLLCRFFWISGTSGVCPAENEHAGT